ncbi:hypothetical protein ZTR_10073 [Talaromyces verruculosus]|nr:hypothetical protein ZTR_10073 [Talaromyces verruculosus]
MVTSAGEDTVCCSCGRLVPLGDVRQLLDEDPILQPLQGRLDNCGRRDGLWTVCSSCYSALFRRSIPKFSALNRVNVTLCKHYPSVLDDLSLPEELLIAKSHPVGVVLKLRPGGQVSPLNYEALKGHFIVIPQDPGPLLHILPSPELQFSQLIKVFWLGHRPPTNADLRPFLVVRKHKVLAALQYLVRNNPLYQGLTVNYSTADSWADEFIPTELQDHIICLNDPDHHERAGYTANLENHNYENDWQAAEIGISEQIESVPLLTGSVATDINGERQNPDIRKLNAIYHLSSDTTTTPDNQDHFDLPPTSRATPVIRYAIKGHATLLNHWQDTHYLLTAFPTLFPMGVGGHIDQRSIPVSPAAFAGWALRHHSRRFMYLMYDMIQLRNSSLGNNLLIKRSQWSSVTRDIQTLSTLRLQDAAEKLTAGQITDDPTIRRLLKNITAISVQVPGSYFQKLRMRSEIRGLIVREGMPAFWMTINPSDLQNPLVLILAGTQNASGSLPTATAAVRQKLAISDPVAVARFFDLTCQALLDGLLGSKAEEIGILGDISNYYGVVESNGRGMLHLHALIWVHGNLDFIHLRNRILADDHFASRMINYLESIIMQSLHSADYTNSERITSTTSPLATESEPDTEFMQKLSQDSDRVATGRIFTEIKSAHRMILVFLYLLEHVGSLRQDVW